MKAIEMTGVRKAFRFFTLEDVSLALEPGQIMGLVGPNGAGKSTTIRLLMGLLSPDAGSIRLLGHDMPRDQAAAKADVGFVSDDMKLLPQATLAWHMDFVASVYPGWDAAYAATLLKRFGLHAGQAAKSLSSGEQAKALLLLALARRPRLLVLDEPTAGMDPVARQELMTEFMDVLRDDERAILFSSHNTLDVERISDRLSFIDRGRVVASDDKEDFLERWRTLRLRLPDGVPAWTLPEIVQRDIDGPNVTLTVDGFNDDFLARLGAPVQEVHRMSLEEVFVATVMHSREVHAS
ncbi:ABC transporter ATP-binding protein [Roseateles sp. BYS78W]|uniref:ABC transporter ATP-binding protein n=1 Tax=Pelomonas candidula TaxID=3299025 RepID=A0ABW7HJ84_9BURK